MAPLRERGLEIVHLDAKQDPGVDVICDLDRANLNLDETLGRYEVVLMLGVLQCLREPDRALDIAASLVAPNGVLVLHHPERARRTFDPYDNMLRASPADLVEALERRGLERVRADSVRIDDPRYYRGIVSRASWIPALGRFWLPLPGFSEGLRRAIPSRRWRQSCLVMRRPAAEVGL